MISRISDNLSTFGPQHRKFLMLGSQPKSRSLPSTTVMLQVTKDRAKFLVKLDRVTISMCYKGKYIPPKKGRTSRRYNGNIQKNEDLRRDRKGARKGLKDTSKTFKLSFLDII